MLMHHAQEKGCSVRDFCAPVTHTSLGMDTTVQKLKVTVIVAYLMISNIETHNSMQGLVDAVTLQFQADNYHKGIGGLIQRRGHPGIPPTPENCKYYYNSDT